MLASLACRVSAEAWRGVSMPCFFFAPAVAGDDATASAPASAALTMIRFMTRLLRNNTSPCAIAPRLHANMTASSATAAGSACNSQMRLFAVNPP